MKILSIDLDFISGPAILHNDDKVRELQSQDEMDGTDMWPVPKCMSCSIHIQDSSLMS